MLLTFIDLGIPWHNNTAERAIRKLVGKRKISGGSKSLEGHKTIPDWKFYGRRVG